MTRLLIISFFIALALPSTSGSASATPLIPQRYMGRGAVILPAASCAAEVGYENHAECAATLYVYYRRWTERRRVRPNLRYTQMVVAYSEPMHTPLAEHSRPWFLFMRLDGRQPRYWPRTRRWDVVQENWMETIEVVRRFYRGELENPCPNARHFAAARHRTRMDGHRRATCTIETNNIFWERE